MKRHGVSSSSSTTVSGVAHVLGLCHRVFIVGGGIHGSGRVLVVLMLLVVVVVAIGKGSRMVHGSLVVVIHVVIVVVMLHALSVCGLSPYRKSI